MKMPKKSDIIICVASLISALALVTTVIMQFSLKNEINSLTLTDTSTVTLSTELFTYNTTTVISSTQASTAEPVGYVGLSETTKSLPKTITEKSTEIDSTLIVNIKTKKIHSSTCAYAIKTKDENKITITSDELQKYLNDGYEMCGVCHGYKE